MTPPLNGFAFPFRIVRGGVARAAGVDKVAQDLRHLLSTRLGERVMRRTYGGGVHQRLQAPNSTTLRALVKHEITQALATFMPEVTLTAPLSVTATESELRIVLEYVADPLDTVRRLELKLSS